MNAVAEEQIVKKWSLLGRGFLYVSTIIFIVFFSNIIVGGFFKGEVWLTDVGELLTLLSATIFFVAGIICLEADK